MIRIEEIERGAPSALGQLRAYLPVSEDILSSDILSVDKSAQDRFGLEAEGSHMLFMQIDS